MRNYAQFCAVAKALDMLGNRWSLLIVRELILGGRRYSDLSDALCGITTNLLAKRLKELCDQGLIEKRALPAPSAATVYVLTDAGQRLEPVIFALGNFGEQFLDLANKDDRRNVRWAALSIKRRLMRYNKIEKLTVSLRLLDTDFCYAIDGGAIAAADGANPHADLAIEIPTPQALGAWFSKQQGLSALYAAQLIHFEGYKRDLRAFSQSIGALP